SKRAAERQHPWLSRPERKPFESGMGVLSSAAGDRMMDLPQAMLSTLPTFSFRLEDVYVKDRDPEALAERQE
ncbi:MAG: hypothetical protein KDA85_15045, partial [Planctomycetaceae bacterium]|nr:hypothetical protein [Planctomycetaceae bacterium]